MLVEELDDKLERIKPVEKELTAVVRIINRLELHVIGDRGKAIDDSPSQNVQVPSRSHGIEPITNELGYRNTFESRDSLLKKIELPVFDGSMPYGWISRVERYFRAAQYNERQKLELVALSLTGSVWNWYSWEIEGEPFKSWIQFKRRVLERFAESIDEEPRNRLCALKQT